MKTVTIALTFAGALKATGCCGATSDAENLSAWVKKQFGLGTPIPPREWLEPCVDGDKLAFASDFDDIEALQPVTGGQQLTLWAKTSRQRCAAPKPADQVLPISFGRALIQFQGGNWSERRAEIVSDPQNPNNRVLAFTINNANVRNEKQNAYKGRVQMNIYDNVGVHRFDMSVRMFIHPDLQLAQSFAEDIHWLTISEWWNNPGWGSHKHPFRISVNLTKKHSERDSPFYFSVKAQTLNTQTGRWNEPLWSNTATHYPVTLGEWITLRYVFEEGNNQTGLFSLTAEQENQRASRIFEIHDFTHHPEDSAPDGLTHINPLKLYTSRRLVDHIRKNGGALTIYWDDLNIRATPSPKRNQ